ncbi:MAG: hypothetical protein M9886_03980 [Candidatus Nanopelagicales bacterium]|nr:hypothetical protein [Candidatus Nanopelagicales bacterium]
MQDEINVNNLYVSLRNSDPDRADEVARSGAEAGMPMIMFLYGKRLLELEQPEAAWRWIGDAAAAGDFEAMRRLARMAFEEEDFESGERWMRVAAANGDAYSVLHFGIMAMAACDTKGAIPFLVNDPEYEIPAACYHAGRLLAAYGETAEAEEVLEDAVNYHDHGPCATYLGKMAWGRMQRDTAREWLERAAGLGDPEAMHWLSVMAYQDGDPTGQANWAAQAAERGNSDAMCSLGIIAEDLGDLQTAEEWYLQAAYLHDSFADERLRRLARQRGNRDEAKVWKRRGNDDLVSGEIYTEARQAEADGLDATFAALLATLARDHNSGIAASLLADLSAEDRKYRKALYWRDRVGQCRNYRRFPRTLVHAD